ncbi:hypothetical protein LKL35_37135 [Streptomyces sp. ET3-23]|uniref:hypothetical protein n=1 Tax=Streptomyces sp. ET3-23 TaxID=2885643 RepID=UPI001D1028C0|nr:hypothetical protein [Streptomyces sp. ET3-23]MCC2280944.1 hypothetical protein [Streptomyces sp. ET3-23]
MRTATLYTAVTIQPKSQNPERSTGFSLGDSQIQEISKERGMEELKKNKFLWAEVKKTFANDGKEEAILSVGRLRTEQVNKMLTDLGSANKDLSFCAVGSANSTSDYDITVGGRGDIQAMRSFNKKFVDWIKGVSNGSCDYESGVVFDTNLYVAGHLPVMENIRAKTVQQAATPQQVSRAELHAASSERRDRAGQDLPKVKAASDEDEILWDGVTEDDFEGNLGPDVLKLSEERQDVYALTKLRKYYGYTEWDIFKTSLGSAMQGKPEWNDTDSRLTSAQELVGTYLKEVLQNCGLTAGPDQGEMEKAIEDLEEGSVNGANKVLHVRNSLYADYSEKARDAFLKFRKEYALKPKPDTGISQWEADRKKAYVSAMDLFVLSLMFAMEAYHSGSAIKDVVANQQANRGLPLTRSQYRDSFNEQTGDFLKDLHHYHSDPPKALIQSSKYLSRICFAGNAVDDRTTPKLTGQAQTDLKKFTTLTSKNPESELLKIRKPDPKYAQMNEIEKGQKAAEAYQKAISESYNMDGMKKKVEDLNVVINACSRGDATEEKRILVVCDMSGQSGGAVPVFNMKLCVGLAKNPMRDVYLLTVQQPATDYAAALAAVEKDHPGVKIALVPNDKNLPADRLKDLLEEAVKSKQRGYMDLPKEPNGISTIIGDSRFSGPAAQLIAAPNGWYPQVQYANIMHMPAIEASEVRGRLVQGFVDSRTEVDLLREVFNVDKYTPPCGPPLLRLTIKS